MNRQSKKPDIAIAGEAPALSRTVELSDKGHRLSWAVPEETPVAIIFNGRNYAVMLATPGDLVDFAIGFSVSEDIVRCLGDIHAIHVQYVRSGAEIRIDISDDRLERLDLIQKRRNLAGRAGCGLCGLENADSFINPLPKVRPPESLIDVKAISKAAASLDRWQKLNAETRTVHGAAWVDITGNIQMVREDVGRHNALDKLVGVLVRHGQDTAQGFVLISSRCSYEIIEKSARAGIAVIATLSGPTAFAIRKAEEANISLYCRSHDGFSQILCESLKT